ncbi:hypothetical protein DH2020_014899 [Rehmannia glutinosa]|uniref:RNA helicase n=1 Tax=Rehmannia glutinosa TaxID=99300 RepID=A0ABR0X115_REHGL
MIIRRRFSRDDQQILADMAYQLGLYFYFHGNCIVGLRGIQFEAFSGHVLYYSLNVDIHIKSHAYNKGNALVVSKVPLPNYRADLDEQHGSNKKEIKISTEIEERVGNLLNRSNGTSVGNNSSTSSETATLQPKPVEISRSASQLEIDAASEELSFELKQKQEKTRESDSVKAMLAFREKLPALKAKSEFLKAVAENQVLIVSGETGCGKTTQLPQFILEEEISSLRGAKCSMICTQPRRISAISVAARVSAERGESLSLVTLWYFALTWHFIFLLIPVKNSIDFRQFESRLRTVLSGVLWLHCFTLKFRMFMPSTSLNTGIYLSCERILFRRCVGENSLQYPIRVRQFSGKFKKSSATTGVEKDPLTELFENADIDALYKGYSASTRKSLGNWSDSQLDLGLVEATIEHICRREGSGAILVFLTGWDDISKLLDKLKANNIVGDPNKFLVLPLHGSMPTINQREIFDRPPPDVRKIVLATNIAESSITIDDVVYVVDCGKAKETSYDALNKLACLLPSWISKASAHQLGGISTFLAKALQPPDPLAVENAIELLKTIGALDDREELTPLGRHLSTLPLDPNIGKMLLMGSVFQCLDPALTIAAALAYRLPFVLPINKKEEADDAKRSFAGDSCSDHIALLKAFEGWKDAKRSRKEKAFCWENFLSPVTLQMMDDMRNQFLDLLAGIGFVNISQGAEAYNQYSDDLEMVCAILCAGLYPKVVQCKRKRKRTALYSKEVGKVDIHPASVNAGVHLFPLPYMVYSEMVKTTSIYLRDSTNISDYALLMFGGNLSPSKSGDGIEMLGGYLHFSASKTVLDLIRKLREELDKLLTRKIEEPGLDVTVEGKSVVAAVIELLHSQNLRYM